MGMMANLHPDEEIHDGYLAASISQLGELGNQLGFLKVCAQEGTSLPRVSQCGRKGGSILATPLLYSSRDPPDERVSRTAPQSSWWRTIEPSAGLTQNR